MHNSTFSSHIAPLPAPPHSPLPPLPPATAPPPKPPMPPSPSPAPAPQHGDDLDSFLYGAGGPSSGGIPPPRAVPNAPMAARTPPPTGVGRVSSPANQTGSPGAAFMVRPNQTKTHLISLMIDRNHSFIPPFPLPSHPTCSQTAPPTPAAPAPPPLPPVPPPWPGPSAWTSTRTRRAARAEGPMGARLPRACSRTSWRASRPPAAPR